MTDLPVEPPLVKLGAAAIRALPAGQYVAMHGLQLLQKGAFWWRLPSDLGGYEFRCDLRDVLMREVCVTGRYEPQETILLRELLRPGQTFVDVGANWGYFTLVGASCVGASGRVIAVEADPRACRALEANLSRNRLTSVTVAEAAADAATGTMELRSYGTDSDDYSRYGVVWTEQSVHGMRFFTVRTRTLDDILDEAGVSRIDLLKLDIEGAEGQALAGLDRRLRAGAVECLLVELHPELLRERGESPRAIVDAICARGFHALRVDHSRDMHRRAAAGTVPLGDLLAPLTGEDDLGDWPHVLLTRKPF